ncbi:DUF4350 domain-containing protein [Phytohabitans rumicis]|uniref:DUF4350 domain-containing protein n=1 Tax=Phytohabitans rumicis TaxID=1076125 RepID=UPI001FE50C06|nr:DUF4350 domain-containing protein [Phytohabitans rumicis]
MVTGVSYAVEEPDPGDPAFLSPTSDADIGGQRLAEALRARGIEVQRVTRSIDARIAARAGDTTLFVPAPDAVHPAYRPFLRLMPQSTRLVLVDPSRRTLDDAGIELTTGARRWAAEAVPPDDGGPCTVDEARAAGVAAALRQRYIGDGDRCYGDGVVRQRTFFAEVVVVGANDPFRNDRIGEHGNEALATALLGTKSRVVWLDLHEVEPPPDTADGPGSATEGPSQAGQSPEGSSGPGRPGSGSGSSGDGQSGSGSSGEENSTADRPNPLWNAFPPSFWALLVQLALAALVFALWRARRLGPPVSEPLPVTVRAAETVLGRGRLYRRAKARGPTAGILRAAARERIAQSLGPDADLVDAVAARTGRDRDEIDALLYGASPETDDELRRLHADLDALVDSLRSAW